MTTDPKINTLLTEFKKLSREERVLFIDEAQEANRLLGRSGLQPGTKVQFKVHKTGATVTGTFVRVKQKYAEVLSKQDRYGIPGPRDYHWSVAPENLVVVP